MAVGSEAIGRSLTSGASVTAPGAGGTICVIGGNVLSAGLVHVQAQAWYGTAAGAANDIQFTAAGPTSYTFAIDAVAGNNTTIVFECIIKHDGLTNFLLKAVAGAAGVYNGLIVATPIRQL